MGSISSGLFISLDGVIESPETWHFDYFDDEMGAVVGELMAGNDATLLGRRTYDVPNCWNLPAPPVCGAATRPTSSGPASSRACCWA